MPVTLPPPTPAAFFTRRATEQHEILPALHGSASSLLADDAEPGFALTGAWFWSEYARAVELQTLPLGNVRIQILTALPPDAPPAGPPTREALVHNLRTARDYGQTLMRLHESTALEGARRARARQQGRIWILAERAANNRRADALGRYLTSLDAAAETDPALNPDILRLARQTWVELDSFFGRCLMVPLAAPASDGSLLFTWHRRTDYLELEIEPDSARTLFYQDESVPRDDPDWEERAHWYAEAAPGEPLPAGTWDHLRRFVLEPAHLASRPSEPR